MKRFASFGAAAFVIAFDFSAGLFVWDFVVIPEIARIVAKRERSR